MANFFDHEINLNAAWGYRIDLFILVAILLGVFGALSYVSEGVKQVSLIGITVILLFVLGVLRSEFKKKINKY